jgi:hypothetical protein
MNIFPSAGFATIAAISFVVYFGGDIMNTISRGFSGTLMSDPVSSVDAKCKPLWLEIARNDLSLKCYMTSDLGRLCKKAERQHLAWLVDEYVEAQDRFDRTLMAYVFRVGINFNTSAAGEKDSLQALAKAQHKSAKEIVTPELKKAMQMDTLLDREVRALFERPFKKGLLVREDLTFRVTDPIEEAFELTDGAYPPKLSACRDAT